MKLDLKELIAKITGQTEFKTLLWTNSSPTVNFAAQSVSLDLSKYDEVEVQFMCWTTVQNLTPPIKVPVGKSGVAFSPLAMNTVRLFTVSTTGISFTGGTQYTNYNTWTQVNDNAPCIPYRIYGIRYVGGGVLLNSILKAFSHLRIGGGVDEGRYKEIGGETARLFLQTCHKRKLDIQRISEWLSRSVVLWFERTLFGRKHKYSLATHSAEDYCFEWGRDNKWNCARTIGESLGFIFKECLHNFQRIGDNIGQTWSVCGLYESVTISGRGWAV